MSKQIRLRVNNDIFNRVLSFRDHMNKSFKSSCAFSGISISYAVKVAIFTGMQEEPAYKKTTVEKAPNILSFQIDDDFYSMIAGNAESLNLSHADIMRICLEVGLPSLNWFIDN